MAWAQISAGKTMNGADAKTVFWYPEVRIPASPDVVLGRAVHVIHVDPVGWQNRHCPNKPPTGIEHKEAEPIRLRHVLESLAERLPAKIRQPP